MMVFFHSVPCFAQAQPLEAAGVDSVQDLKDLAADMEDKAAREKLLSRIRALIAARETAQIKPPVESFGARLIANLSKYVRDTSRQMVTAAEAFRHIPVLAASIRDKAANPKIRKTWLDLIFKVLLIVVSGGVCEVLIRLLLRQPRQSLEERAADTFWVRLPLLAGRTVLDVVPIAGFAAAAYTVAPMIQPTPLGHVMVLTLINAYLIVSVTLAVIRMLLAPAVNTLRILPLTDVSANYLFIWARRIAGFSVFGFFFAEAALLLGLPPGGHAVLLRLLGLAITSMVVVFILQNRTPVAGWIRGKSAAAKSARLRSRFADIWHVLAIIYTTAIYAVWILGIDGGFEYLARATVITGVILIAARLIIVGLDRAVERGFALRADIRDRFPALEERANRYVPALRLLLRWGICLIAALILLETWGLDVLGWLSTPLGTRVSESIINILAVVIVALVFWEVVSNSVETYLRKSDGEGHTVERSARVRTLLPLLRKVVSVALAVMVVLIVFAELGIEIGPLLAGAGVIGLAIGFGAQTLVKDVITGLFILIEDTIAVGDYVEVGKHEGDVESLSIRTIRLRDPAGSVHTVPFSEVGTVLNYTKDYSNVVLNIGISYRENVDEVMKVLEELGQEMADDPVLGRDVITPLFVQGLQSLDDSAVVIRARIKVTAGTQWRLKREFNRLMKNRFDELGIEIPFPQRTLTFANDAKDSSGAELVMAERPPERADLTSKNEAKNIGRKADTADGQGDGDSN
ncbi:MAG: mechanosensitive ion channel [Rhodospirillaceae bacterium]|nr:mechanosensitive ion channel [Rhodospirillaceae bacterium]MBT7250320.1 mechanosensitive ion channel [Rhodospirillaceae bacterium]